MAYLVACLVSLRDEFNRLNPDRDKSSDGWIGDEAHQSTDSDHNPDSKGAVHAIDVDETGPWPDDCTMEKMVQYLVAECRKSGESGKDRGRLKYIIYERRIWKASNGWAQESYSGSNPHDKHMHVSCEYASKYENDTASWGIADEFGDTVSQQDVINALKSTEGQKLIGQAVLGYDPGKNSDGTYPKGAIKNLDPENAKDNPTVGLAWAAGERSQTAVDLGYQIRTQGDTILRTLDTMLSLIEEDQEVSEAVAQIRADIAALSANVDTIPAETVALLSDPSTPDEQVAQALRSILGDRLPAVVALLQP